MISKEEIQDILQNSKGDFCELFFERQDETNIILNNGAINGLRTKHLYGVGLYLLDGIKSVYLYTNDSSYKSLSELMNKANRLMKLATSNEIVSNKTITLNEIKYKNPNIIKILPSTISYDDKIKILNDAYKNSKDCKNLISAQLDYIDVERKILVANSEGVFAEDRRINSKVRFNVITGDEKESFSHWEDFTRTQGFEAFEDNQEYIDFGKNLINRVENMRKAETIKPRRVPVILAAGACGTLWHECCGHTLEATAIASNQSDFVGKLNKKVANEKVTIIDDGTIPNYYGTNAIDDEGHKMQRNVLIENGILKGYMCDRLHGRMIGMESTGNGRRQNYTFAPVARMTNTFLAAGNDDEKEIISSVDEGLYVESLGGGFGGTQFSLQVNEGFLIKNGKIDRQIKGIMLTGNGLEVMNKIDRVGKNLAYEGGSFCGASSGLVPVTATQPMVRISEMAIG